MGITDRVEQLHRALEAMNAWHAANGAAEEKPAAEVTVALHSTHERIEPELPAAPGSGRDDTRSRGPVAAPEPQPRPLDRLVDDLLPVRREAGDALTVAADAVESLGLGYHLGAAVERIAVASQAGADGVEPLREAAWLIERYAELLERRPVGADLHRSSSRLARTGEEIAELRALSAMFEAASAPEPEPAPTKVQTEAVEPGPAPAQEPTQSLGAEIVLTAARWTIMAAAVIVVVLAVTLIGQWL